MDKDANDKEMEENDDHSSYPKSYQDNYDHEGYQESQTNDVSSFAMHTTKLNKGQKEI